MDGRSHFPALAKRRRRAARLVPRRPRTAARISRETARARRPARRRRALDAGRRRPPLRRGHARHVRAVEHGPASPWLQPLGQTLARPGKPFAGVRPRAPLHRDHLQRAGLFARRRRRGADYDLRRRPRLAADALLENRAGRSPRRPAPVRLARPERRRRAAFRRVGRQRRRAGGGRGVRLLAQIARRRRRPPGSGRGAVRRRGSHGITRINMEAGRVFSFQCSVFRNFSSFLCRSVFIRG